MPSALDVLHYKTMTAVVQNFKFPELVLQSLLFPTVNIDGDTAEWDILKPTREMAGINQPDAPAQRVALEPVGHRLAKCFKVFEKKHLGGDFLNALREPGTKNRNATAYLTREEKTLARRNARRKEWACSQALTGTLTVATDEVRVAVDYSIPAGNKPTAAVTWATATTDIMSDLNTWKTLIPKESGYTAGIAIANSKVRGYLLKNTGVKELLGEGDTKAKAGLSGDIGQFAGLTWMFYDAGYKDSAGTFYNYVADNYLIIVPIKEEIAEVCAMQSGTVPVPSAGNESITYTQGETQYSKTTDDPVGIDIFEAENWLPVIMIPGAFIYADLVP